MASSRIFSSRSISRLAATGSKHQLRRLHITGANATPSPLLSSETTTGTYPPRNITDLKTECRNRNLKVHGSKIELVERLSSHDLSQRRELTTAMAPSRRPLAAASQVIPPPTRHFNTSRALKAINDSSTIDFAYMPQFELVLEQESHLLRVPLLPDNYYPARKSAAHQEAVEPVMRPEISVMSGQDTHIAGPSAMSEVVDNHAMDIDPFNLTSKVHAAASKIAGFSAEKPNEPGMLKELWNGFLEDLTGTKKVGKA